MTTGSAGDCVKKPIGINGGRIKNNITALQLQTFAIEAVLVSNAKGLLHSFTPLSYLVFFGDAIIRPFPRAPFFSLFLHNLIILGVYGIAANLTSNQKGTFRDS